MTHTEDPGADAIASASSKPLGQSTEDIDIEWIETMINRLLKESRRQISQIEGAKTGADTKDEKTNIENIGFRERNARTLASLARTVKELHAEQRLIELSGKSRAAKKKLHVKKNLERRITVVEDGA